MPTANGIAKSPKKMASMLRAMADMLEGEEMSEEKPAAMKIAKTDDDEQLVFGWAYVSEDADGRLIVDSDNDVIEKEELERAVYDYVLDVRKGGERHTGTTTGRLVESLMLTPDKAEAMGMEAPVSGWWVGFKIDDPACYAKVKSGEYAMFSIEGTAMSAEVMT